MLYKTLKKAMTYLFSINWNTRIIASLLIEEIVQYIPVWLPKPHYCLKQKKTENPFLQFENFRIVETIKKGKPLLSGEDYEVDWATIKNTKKRMKLQRLEL